MCWGNKCVWVTIVTNFSLMRLSGFKFNGLPQLRGLVILALLIGLTVSSGEGLRLFPIPASGSSTGAAIVELSPQTSTRYQFAVHRFGSSAKTLTAKVLKKQIAPESSDHLTTGFRNSSIKSSVISSTSSFTPRTATGSAGLSFIPEGRAPPTT
jgi:hypothetical protein